MNRTNPSARKREQRERQRAYRDEMRAIRKPGRDDIARAWLWRSLAAAINARDGGEALNKIQDAIVETLMDQGFDEGQSERALFDILDRYNRSSVPPFRKKRHLGRDDGSDS